MSANEFWAQLVSITDIESSPVLITKNKFVIGRNEDCDLSFAGNKLVSGNHCYIERDDDDHKVWLNDTSTNGTLLNMKSKVSKGSRLKLEHGDEIYVVYKKTAPQENIGYLYQEKDSLENEMTQDYSYEADATLSDDMVNQLNESTSSGDTDKNVSLKRKTPQDEKAVSNKKQKTEKPEEEPQIKKPESKVDDKAKPSTSKDAANVSQDVDMLLTLTCIICQEILHDCISLQPCMHSFCAGCYSEWMDKSDLCPSCRMKVDRINKNHLVNNLVEAYLKAHPDQKRPESDLEELDEKNKITRDMLYPDKPPLGIDENSGSTVDEDDDDDHDNDDDDHDNEDDDSDENGGGFGGAYVPPANAFGNAFPGFGCKQCPNYNGPQGIQPHLRIVDPNDEDAKTFPTPPGFTCRPNQNHVLCLCCMHPMPDRRNEYIDGGRLPPQRCTFCFRSFCHAYWGCESPICNGCIGKLKDLNFGQRSLASIILDNGYESNVMKDYLTSKGMSVKTLLGECLAKVVTGEYTCVNQEKLTFGINTPLCYACGFTIFKDLAYSYRKNIPKEDLPQEVIRRPDCYWGKNCRTQHNKPEHAKRFNHICDQTRTA